MVKHRMTVHLFGATSSPSCANFSLRKCAEDNVHQFSAQAVNTIMNNPEEYKRIVGTDLTKVEEPENKSMAYIDNVSHVTGLTHKNDLEIYIKNMYSLLGQVY